MSDIDLLLVNPNNKKRTYGKLSASLSAVEPPVWSALIASFARERGYSAGIIDADAENLSPEDTAERIRGQRPLLLAIGALGANPSASSTPKMPAVRDLIRLLRGSSAVSKIALYGLHPSALPERTLREEGVDFVLRGECFYTITALLEMLSSGGTDDNFSIEGLWYMRDGRVVSNGWGKMAKDLDSLPFAAWDLLPMSRYRAHNWHCFGQLDRRAPYAAIYTSLGCPYDCAYCNIRALYNGRPGIRYRSPENVIGEIDLLVREHNVRNIKILDELFILNKGRIMKLCDLLIGRGYDLNIWAYARIDTVSEAVLKRMRAAGIRWLCYGIESANKEVRKGVSKGRFDSKNITETIDMTRAAGINIIGNFMFGLPEDDLATMRETLALAKKLNCEYANFYVTMAYPGSRLYDELKKDGFSPSDNWAGYSQLNEETLAMRTKHLQADEVLRFRDDAFNEYYGDPRYQKMIADKFGVESAEHIRKMMGYKIQRKFA